MGLKQSEIERIREELLSSKKPAFIYHDDADGLCSFLLLYRYIKEGKGIVVKSRPYVDEKFISRVSDCDKVFILDIATVKQEFINEVKVPVIWIDHHAISDLENVTYFNPRKHKPDIAYPVTNICYDIVQQDIWIAMAGCVGDWVIPKFTKEFFLKYPDLMDENITDPGRALFSTRIGFLVKIINFILKGPTSDAMRCVKIMSSMKEPYEILDGTSEGGKYILKKFEEINSVYSSLLLSAKKLASSDRLFIFTYPDNKMSFTGELSNELLFLYPDKLIIVARQKDGEMRMSLRSSKVKISEILEKALLGLEGYGGGHEYACGACVKTTDFDKFVERIRLLS